MRAIAIGAGFGALALAVASSAQVYGYGYGYPHPNGYGGYTQIAINRCTDAVQRRLDSTTGDDGGYGAARVLGISRVLPHGRGGEVMIEGVATSGRNAPHSFGAGLAADLTWQCATDDRGIIVGLSVEPGERGYGYAPSYQGVPVSPYDYSQYGYRRY